MAALSGCSLVTPPARYVSLEKMRTFAGLPKEQKGASIKEPFGLAFGASGDLFISDGEAGKIWRADKTGALSVVTDKLDTPSGIAFGKDGDLYAADSGTHTIKRIEIENGEVSTLAGIEGKAGFADGEAASAQFNAPVGIAVDADGRVYVADTYNDRIRVIENGRVTTIAGSVKGFADSPAGAQARFDTPCGIAISADGADGAILVADTGNRRVRQIDRSGAVTTIAGGGANEADIALPLDKSFAEPVAVLADENGVIYIADGAANSIFAIGHRTFPVVEKLNSGRRGAADGDFTGAKLNRPSGMAADAAGNLYIADADNQLVRVVQGKDGQSGAAVSKQDIADMRLTAEAMRAAAPARWPYEPPARAREIAGTLGEVRGESGEGKQAWFHNGLDIVGGYGETARFIRTEKVLRPLAAQLFGTLRENLRLPTVGYIHLKLGRDQTDRAFADERFQWSHDETGRMAGVRVRRGTKFSAGDAIGTLNSMNHVHMIAGRAGSEINALSALELPGISDKIAPVIENVALYGENWQPLSTPVETKAPAERINLTGKVRIVAKCYDRMDGNAERRRLGVYRAGYQLLRADGTPAAGFEEPRTAIRFDKLPDDTGDTPRIVYFDGSKSGATGETIFNYNVTNFVQGGAAREDVFDTTGIAAGEYILRVIAADYFDNVTTKDIRVSIGQ